VTTSLRRPLVLLLFGCLSSLTTAVLAGTTELVSVSYLGGSANSESDWPAISADGRYVAFASDASDLVSGDTNGVRDIFVRDTATGVTERVSVSGAGSQADDYSDWPAISANGRYVAFCSPASNLAPDSWNWFWQVFIKDLQTGNIECVSRSTSGQPGNGHSLWPSINSDGRFVGFTSDATDLAGSGDTNGFRDAFIHDRWASTTGLVSVATSGEQGNGESEGSAISGDGRFVAFTSAASNLVLDDTNGYDDVFVRDRTGAATERVSIGISGQGNANSGGASISENGARVVFSSYASNLVAWDTNGCIDVFLRDRTADRTWITSVNNAGVEGNWNSGYACISGDGQVVAFGSYASNLASGDSAYHDVFVRDLRTSRTSCVSLNTSQVAGNGASDWPVLSGDGRYVAFPSLASTLAPSDTNGTRDVFIHDRARASVIPVSPYPSKSEWDSGWWYPHRGQLHAHRETDVPGDDVTPGSDRDLLEKYVGDGYDFLAITEHHMKFNEETWQQVFIDPGVDGIVSMVGSVEDTGPTHILGIGFSEGADLSKMGSGDTKERLSNIRDNGGLAFFAHPDEASTQINAVTLCSPDLRRRYDGIELYNSMVHLGALLNRFCDPDAWDATLFDQAFAVEKWDKLLGLGLHGVWGIAGDDYHPLQSAPWRDDAAVVAWTTYSASPNRDQIKGALEHGRFYACKGGSKAPWILAHWADPVNHEIAVRIQQKYNFWGSPRKCEITFVSGDPSQPPMKVTATDQGGDVCLATMPRSYAAGDRFIRAEVRDDKGNTCWLQPIWITVNAGTSGSVSAMAAPVRAASISEPLLLTLPGATLNVAPQPSIDSIDGFLVSGDDLPAAPPMAFLSLCYEFVPSGPAQVLLEGENQLSISYYADLAQGFQTSNLGIYRFDAFRLAWQRLVSIVDEANATVTTSIDRLGVFTVSAEPPSDAGPPTVSIVAPLPGSSIAAPMLIIAEADDDQGVSGVSFYLDGWPIGTDRWGADGWTTVLDPAGYSPSAKTITAVAEDGVGNKSSAETIVTVVGLMLAPAISITSPAEGEVVWGDVEASGSWSGQLPLSLCALSIDDQPLAVLPNPDDHWEGAVPVQPDLMGDRILKVTGFDMNGNRAEASVSVQLRAFLDIGLDYWAQESIYAIARAGITTGYPDGTYQPLLPVTRAQMAAYITRALAGGDAGIPVGPASPSFADISKTDWSYKYVEYAKAQGIVSGYPDGLYHPNDAVDRGQMAVFLARAVSGGEAAVPTPSETPIFPDMTSQGTWSWCYKHVQYIASEGVTQGYPDGRYHPEYVCTRDQMAVYLARAFDLPVDQ